MTWDPYGMPDAPRDIHDKRDHRRPVDPPPASMRLVAAVILAMIVLALVFTIAANAQEATTQEPGSEGQTQQPAVTSTEQATEGEAQPPEAAEAEAMPLDGQIVEQPAGTYAASDLIGRAVMSAEGENMGNISDLLIDEDNRIAGVVIGVGGFLGFGEKRIAVEPDSLTRSATQEGGEQLVLDYTRAELEQAPEFVTLAELEQRQQAEQASQQQMEQQQQGSGETSGQLTK